MNEFLKLCKENGIDLEGAQALMEMAHGDGRKAIEFIKYMRGEPEKVNQPPKIIKHGGIKVTLPTGDYNEQYKRGVTESIYGRGKHGIIKGPNSNSSLYCDHANECPSSNPCSCLPDCYCRVHGNCGTAEPMDGHNA